MICLLCVYTMFMVVVYLWMLCLVNVDALFILVDDLFMVVDHVLMICGRNE